MARSPKRTTDAKPTKKTDNIPRVRGGFGGYDAPMTQVEARPTTNPRTMQFRTSYGATKPTHPAAGPGTATSYGAPVEVSPDEVNTDSGHATGATGDTGVATFGRQSDVERGDARQRHFVRALQADDSVRYIIISFSSGSVCFRMEPHAKPADRQRIAATAQGFGFDVSEDDDYDGSDHFKAVQGGDDA